MPLSCGTPFGFGVNGGRHGIPSLGIADALINGREAFLVFL